MNINIRKNKKMEKILNIGKVDMVDAILPGVIDFSNPMYLYMDDMYFSGIIITNYAIRQNINWILPLFNLDFNVNISMFYEKLNSTKVIRELTYHIGNIDGAIRTVNSNQQDIDIMQKAYEDSKYIRHKLQVEKEELYNLCIYMSVFSKSLDEVKFNIARLEAICATMGLQTRRAIFRQEQVLNAMLPICKNSKDIKGAAARNVLTDGLTSTYPFISSELYDEEGILIGENTQNNSLIVVDRFCSSKYKNPNMCILGTSGAGKSFFVKLMILRNRYIRISQFVIDPDGEYFKLCNELGGTYIKVAPNSGQYINIMDIRENAFTDDEEKVGYLVNKLPKLKIFFSLLFKDMTDEEEILLEEKIVECYSKKGITFDDNSLYKSLEGKIRIKKVFKTSDEMPILEDLYKILNNSIETKRLALKLKPYISGGLSFFNQYTNIDLNNILLVADISRLTDESIPLSMYLIIDMFWDRIKQNRGEKKIIYIDEIWRLIGSSGNLETAEFIYKIFKTIRKFGGAATAITQDVSDFFMLEDGKYGKAVVNNSALKFVLQLEKEDIEILKEILNISEEEILKIRNFERGYGLLFSNKNRVVAKVEANKIEYSLITTDRKDFENDVKVLKNKDCKVLEK